MYLGHLVVYRRSLLDRVGGIREGYDGSQDYDLALRATERARRVTHLPAVLYHWRIHDASVSHRQDNEAVFDAARRALSDHLRRVGIRGTVEQVHPVGVYRIHRRPARYPLVSLVVPTRGSRGFVGGADRAMVVHALSGVAARSTYPAIEVVVVADRATPPATLAALRAVWGDRLRVLTHEGPFNFSAQVNRGVLHAAGELVVLLNDDIEVLTGDWLETMAGLALESDVGMVGAKLLYADDTVQHVGHLYERNDASHLAAGAPADWPGPQADLLVEREVSGVTAACAMLRRAVFAQVGGLSPELPINFNDVDLSMKITQAGYRIVVTPHAVLYHFESKSRPRIVTASEVDVLRRRWNRRLQVDPYWRHDPAAVRAGIARFRG
jgi:GT2 family glycosyltransferase